MFRFGLDVNGNGVRAGFHKARHVMIGVLDHQMHIEGKFRLFADNFDDHWAKRNVVDEMAIHDVAMDPIGAGVFNFANLRRQI